MLVKDLIPLLDAELIYGSDDIDIREIHSGCGSDMMSDVLAFVKDQPVLLRGLCNPQVIRTAEMMDIMCLVFVRGKRPDEKMIEAMYVAAGIGQIIANRAYLAGASGGCQAEIGSGSGMAAGAICYIRGGDTGQIGDACAMALKNLMGLVCDPVGGLVEVPCVKRNVGGAVNALAAADMALAGITSKIPVDQVIDAMKEVGDKMDVSLRETGIGGVAGSPAAMEVVERLDM